MCAWFTFINTWCIPARHNGSDWSASHEGLRVPFFRIWANAEPMKWHTELTVFSQLTRDVDNNIWHEARCCKCKGSSWSGKGIGCICAMMGAYSGVKHNDAVGQRDYKNWFHSWGNPILCLNLHNIEWDIFWQQSDFFFGVIILNKHSHRHLKRGLVVGFTGVRVGSYNMYAYGFHFLCVWARVYHTRWFEDTGYVHHAWLSWLPCFWEILKFLTPQTNTRVRSIVRLH